MSSTLLILIIMGVIYISIMIGLIVTIFTSGSTASNLSNNNYNPSDNSNRNSEEYLRRQTFEMDRRRWDTNSDNN